MLSSFVPAFENYCDVLIMLSSQQVKVSLVAVSWVGASMSNGALETHIGTWLGQS